MAGPRVLYPPFAGAARDALYIESRDGPIKRLKRMPWNAKDAAWCSTCARKDAASD